MTDGRSGGDPDGGADDTVPFAFFSSAAAAHAAGMKQRPSMPSAARWRAPAPHSRGWKHLGCIAVSLTPLELHLPSSCRGVAAPGPAEPVPPQTLGKSPSWRSLHAWFARLRHRVADAVAWRRMCAPQAPRGRTRPANARPSGATRRLGKRLLRGGRARGGDARHQCTPRAPFHSDAPIRSRAIRHQSRCE